MQQQGYDELSNKAQKNLDDTLKYVEGNAEAQEQVVAMMLKRVEQNYDSAYSAIQAKIKQTGTVVGKTAEKQIADLNGTLAPLQAWATQVQENEDTLSSFQTQWETVVDNISTNPIRFMTVGAQEALENLGLLTKAMKEYRSVYEEMVGGLEANGQQKTSYTDADDKKRAEQAAGGETAEQAKSRRNTLTKMYNYAASRKVADVKAIKDHEKDDLWNYLYKLTGGKDASATEMAHLAQYLRDLGADLEGVPYKSKVTKEEDLSMDARNKILAAMKQYGFGTNQGAGQYIYSRNRTPDAGTVTKKQSDVLWKYIYDTTGQDLTEAEMLHIGKAYTNVSGLPTEASGKKLTDAQKKAIVTALQYNGFDLEGYVLSANYGKSLASTTSFKSDNKTTKITATNAATTSSGNITSDIKKAEEQNLKEYIKGITGKTPTDKELVQLAVDQKISGVTADQKSLNETQAAALLKKLKDTGWNSSKKGYAKGTTSIPYTGSHWTHSGELLVRKDGAYLTPLSKGDGVIPANLTENLMKWGAVDPSAFLMKMGKVPTANNTSNNTYNNSYESLLTVYGDVDKEALPELQEILKKACDYTNKYNAREARKLGRK